MFTFCLIIYGKYGNESDVKRDHLSCDVSYPKTGIMYLYPSKETHPEIPIWFTYVVKKESSNKYDFTKSERLSLTM